MQTSQHTPPRSRSPQILSEIVEEDEDLRSPQFPDGVGEKSLVALRNEDGRSLDVDRKQDDSSLNKEEEPDSAEETDEEIEDSVRARPRKKEEDSSELDHQDDLWSDDDGEPDADPDEAGGFEEADKVHEGEVLDDDPDNGNEDRPGTVIAD